VVHDDAAQIRAEVVHKAFRGAEILYTLRLASGRKPAIAASGQPKGVPKSSSKKVVKGDRESCSTAVYIKDPSTP
jgi:hypothetical protein